MKKYIIPGLVIICAALVGAVYLFTKTLPSKPLTPKAKAAFSQKSSAVSPASDLTPTQAPERVPAPPAPADQDKVIKEIRKELETVMDLNKKINSVQQSKSAQLLRIQEQALIHQQILLEIQKTAGDKLVKTPSRETLLAQEKLRIIREETLRNKKLLEDTSRKPAV